MHHLAHQVSVPLAEWAMDAPGDVALDAGIVELVQALWAVGVETVQSCEAGAGSDGVNDAWVSFAEPNDAWDFARTLVEASGGHTELAFNTDTGALLVAFPRSYCP